MKTKIGGQAVIEGVMMRGSSSMALAVRDETGQIRMETTRYPAKKPWYKKVPFLRGIISLVTSLIAGTKIIAKSAEIMVEDEVEISNGKGMSALMGLSTVLGIVLAVCLFIVIPTAITGGIFALAKLDDQRFAWLKSLIEGVAKMGVLVGYMALISRMKEIKRLFMYHGAEHKTIACFESEMPLTVENVQKCSRYHDRCGTSFIVFVVIMSIVLMMVLDIICAACNFTAFIEKKNWWLRALLRLALLPLTAGISYEMLMLLANSNFVLFRPLKWLGKQFQKLTTKEPDDSMCEVAIASFNAVLEMDSDESVAEVKFPAPITMEEFRTKLSESGIAGLCGIKDEEWLLLSILRVKKENLSKVTKIPFGWVVRLEKMADRLKNGEPWQYVIGSCEFFGRNFDVDNNVLIPRQETELVCEQLLKRIDKKSSVLDLCCGSGVLGITAALEKKSTVTLVDVSEDALKVAKRNAKRNKAKVEFIKSDMFSNLCGKCNVIVCNPPYVETEVIDTLDDSVKNYEPHIALDGGKDGLDFYRILAEKAPKFLTKRGLLILEIGYNQGESVKELLCEKFETEVLKDYGNNDRIVIAELKMPVKKSNAEKQPR